MINCIKKHKKASFIIASSIFLIVILAIFSMTYYFIQRVQKEDDIYDKVARQDQQLREEKDRNNTSTPIPSKESEPLYKTQKLIGEKNVNIVLVRPNTLSSNRFESIEKILRNNNKEVFQHCSSVSCINTISLNYISNYIESQQHI